MRKPPYPSNPFKFKLTNREKAELADMPEEAQEVFYTTAKRWWYVEISVTLFVFFVFELTLWSLHRWWVVAYVYLCYRIIRYVAFDRSTDISALARARMKETKVNHPPARKANISQEREKPEQKSDSQ